MPKAVQTAVERKARRLAKQAGAVLISDYGLGAATPALVRKLSAKRIMLDSRYRLLEYAEAGVTAATPNEPELESAYQSLVGTNTRKLDELGRSRAPRTGPRSARRHARQGRHGGFRRWRSRRSSRRGTFRSTVRMRRST